MSEKLGVTEFQFHEIFCSFVLVVKDVAMIATVALVTAVQTVSQ